MLLGLLIRLSETLRIYPIGKKRQTLLYKKNVTFGNNIEMWFYLKPFDLTRFIYSDGIALLLA